MLEAITQGKIKKVAIDTKTDDKNNIVTNLHIKLEVEDDVEKAREFLRLNGQFAKLTANQLQLSMLDDQQTGL